MIGFGVTTFIMYCVLCSITKKDLNSWAALSILAVTASAGFGSLNEILEFIVGEIVSEAGVGGYVNTSLDLISNLIGAIIAMALIRFRRKSPL